VDEVICRGIVSGPDSRGLSVRGLRGVIRRLDWWKWYRKKWFTASQYDVGRQWISRVTRSEDHRIARGCPSGGNPATADDSKLPMD